MSVIRFQSVRMPDDQKIAVTSRIPCRLLHPYHTVKCYPYRVPPGKSDVRTPVFPDPPEGITAFDLVHDGTAEALQRVGKNERHLIGNIFQRDFLVGVNGR